MNNQESGRLGGIATRDNHPTLCRECGQLIKSRFYSELGAKGGQTTNKRHGPELYRKNGKFSGRGITKEKRIAKFGYDPLAKTIPAAESSGLEKTMVGVVCPH